MNIRYKEDVLRNGFEQTVITQRDDYEGNVTATLVRKLSTVASTKAILCIHGFNDYFFQEVLAEKFVQQGYHFYALDLRKYGRSILKNHIPNNVRDLSEYYEDIDKALAIIKDEENTEVVLYGHSTGGLIITLYAAERQKSPLFEVLVCNSPFYDFNIPWFHRKVGIPFLAFLGKLYPNLVLPIGFSKFYGKSLHKNDFGEWDYNLKWKPHIAPSINAGWINAIYQGHCKIAKGISVSKPILILHSLHSVYPKKWSKEMFEGDAILNVKDIIEKSKLIEAPCKEVIGFKGAIHDLVLSKMEVRNLVFETIFTQLNLFLKTDSKVQQRVL